jgi:copper chaperone CopZ
VVVRFAVENAGCSSCVKLVGEALSAIGDVELVELDEEADLASVSLDAATALSVEDVDTALARASEGSGHAYRVQPGSWTVAVD